MSQAIRHRGPDGEHQVIAGSVGLAHRHLWVTPEEVGERQPLVGRRGTLLALDGRLDNREELIARLDLARSASDATCLLAALEAWGEQAIERLAGDFAFAAYDPGVQRLLLARDAIGVRPIYYTFGQYRGERFCAFASEIKALLAHPGVPARPDDEGVADYLLLGERPAERADRTCFAGIAALPPAHVLAVTPRGAAPARRYWDFDPELRHTFARFEDCAAAFRERFENAVRRRVRSGYPVAVSVSGGLDSSSIFCQAETLRRGGAVACPALLGVSYVGEEGSAADERAYLEEIERAYGVSIERIPMAPLLGLLDGAELQAWHVETPLSDSLWPITHRLQELPASRGARRFLSGHWADQVLHSTAYLVDLVRGLEWRTARRHALALEDWFHPEEARALRREVALDLIKSLVPTPLAPLLKRLRRRIVRPDLQRRWLSAEFRARALRQAHRPASVGQHLRSAHQRALYLEARVTYTVQCLEWNNKVAALHGLDHAFPFLDRDLVQFLMGVPGVLQAHQGVPRALIRQGLAGILPDAIRQRRWKGDYSDPANRGAAEDLARVRAWLASGLQSVAWGYVDPAALQAELERLAPRLAGPDCVASWELAELVGLESWLRVFFK